jgi:hypothetical protein
MKGGNAWSGQVQLGTPSDAGRVDSIVCAWSAPATDNGVYIRSYTIQAAKVRCTAFYVLFHLRGT